MEAINERAREVGRLLAQTDEYRALKRANEQIGDDRETVTLLNRAGELQESLAQVLRGGGAPTQEQQDEYEGVLSELERRSAYQRVVASQANFDRLMMRVNEEIARGIQSGEESRIILSS